MKRQITLYSRKECCLCEEMKAVISAAAARLQFEYSEIDIDADPQLRAEFNDQAPVLFIDGRKAFKYRVTQQQLEKHLKRRSSFWSKLGFSS